MLNGKNSNGYGAAGRKSVKFPGSRNKGWRLPKISNSELWGNKMNERNTNSESKSEVADAVIHLLWSVDHREWPCVISSFEPSVEVDYTSLSGVSPLIQRSEDLVSGWKKFLPGFNKTQHLAGPVLVKVEGNIASAWCAITATHTLGKERWIVGGHY